MGYALNYTLKIRLNLLKVGKKEGGVLVEYIKSPLNYTGGKYKLLPQITKIFPEEIGTFYDIFTGGLNVGVNINTDKTNQTNKETNITIPNASRIVSNDIQSEIIDLFENLKTLTGQQAMSVLDEIITKYDLSDQNQEGYLKLRAEYNQDKTWDKFYALVIHSFNNQIRFNNKGGYNMPFGKGRSWFNPKLRERFVTFVDQLNTLGDTLEFTSKNFLEFSPTEGGKSKDGLHTYDKTDLIYCDPPYLISTATYNTGWGEKEERELLEMLDKFNQQGIRFALSNVICHKGQNNQILQDWIDQREYKTHYLNIDYSNCSYHKTDRGNNDTIEVLIKNWGL